MTKKQVRTTQFRKKTEDDGLALVVVVCSEAGLLVGYLLAEMVLAVQPHPFHWAVMALGGFFGVVIGKSLLPIQGRPCLINLCFQVTQIKGLI